MRGRPGIVPHVQGHLLPVMRAAPHRHAGMEFTGKRKDARERRRLLAGDLVLMIRADVSRKRWLAANRWAGIKVAGGGIR